MKKEHHYNIELTWTGNKGTGTATYESYGREHTISVESKPDLYGSSDPAFMGDASRYNPEEMLVSSLSACHMLWYLHLCSRAGVVVNSYSDRAEGTLAMAANGSGNFKQVILHPYVVVASEEMIAAARVLHNEANKMCFIARSCNFPVLHQPVIVNSSPKHA